LAIDDLFSCGAYFGIEEYDTWDSVAMRSALSGHAGTFHVTVIIGQLSGEFSLLLVIPMVMLAVVWFVMFGDALLRRCDRRLERKIGELT